MIHTALTIAGSDPSGGAGIQADLKTFSANGVYGMSAITALTVQNTQGVRDIHLLDGAFVSAQIEAIFDDIRVDAIKIGMIANAQIAAAVAQTLKKQNNTTIVLDPVMIAKGGHALLEEDAIATLQRDLLPLADILTPNLEEAARLLNTTMATSREQMQAQGEALLKMGVKSVLMKGGHLDAKDSPDLLISDGLSIWYEAKRIETPNTHGTGCTLSSAIAAAIAKGTSHADAITAAKEYVHGAISSANKLDIGSGHGPTHHFHALWQADK